MFDRESFTQVIEGKRSNISSLALRFCNDSRHSGLTIIHARPIECRLFGDWSMTLIEKGQGGDMVQPLRMTGEQVIEYMLAQLHQQRLSVRLPVSV